MVILVMRDFDVPLEGVLWVVVELDAFVSELHGVIVVELVGVVAVATELRDVLFEGVFRVAGEFVLDDYVVRGGLRGAVGVEGCLQCLLVRLTRLMELALFVSVRIDEAHLQRLRDRRHPSCIPHYSSGWYIRQPFGVKVNVGNPITSTLETGRISPIARPAPEGAGMRYLLLSVTVGLESKRHLPSGA